MSFISLNKSVWKFPCFRLWQATELPNKVSLFFFPPRDAAMFLYFRLTSMSVSDEKFLSSHSSLIYLTLSSPLPHTHTHTQMIQASWRSTFRRSCWSVCPNVPLCQRSAIAGTPTRWDCDTLEREISKTARRTACWWLISGKCHTEKWRGGKKNKKNNRIADILFMTLKLWHQEIKGISPSPQKKLRVALHSIWGILLCTPKNSEFRLRNWLQGLQKYRASRLWNKKWGYRLNVSSADCYSPQKALGQLDKYYYLNLPLLLWKHGRLLILWHIPDDWRFFCLTFSDISFTAHLVIFSSQPKLEKSKKRLWGKSSKVATTQSEDLSVKAS